MCAGELTPEKECRSREQMNAVYNTIVSRGLAEEDQIFFVSGRGGTLNSTLKSNDVATGYNFRMYGPVPSNVGLFGGGGGGGFNFGGTTSGAFGGGGGVAFGGGGGAFGGGGGAFGGGGGAFGGGGGAFGGGASTGSTIFPTEDNNGL